MARQVGWCGGVSGGYRDRLCDAEVTHVELLDNYITGWFCGWHSEADRKPNAPGYRVERLTPEVCAQYDIEPR